MTYMADETSRAATPAVAPLDAGVLADLGRVSTETLATQLYKQGIRQPFLVGLAPLSENVDGFVGEAVTMRFIPAREDIDPMGDPYRTGNVLQWEAIEQIGPGQVLVVDSGGDTSAASAGDILITRAMMRGANGFVTDGALRDGKRMRHLKFATYARSVTATTRPAYFHVADLHQPIGCAGVAVYPGDVVVGDRDGVVVVPRSMAAGIARPAVEQERLESYVQLRIQAGDPLWGVYPPDDATRREYAAWRDGADDRGVQISDATPYPGGVTDE
ncbi:MAG: ribonuclease activity regulator RraA [Nocardioidaceae bacterium]